MSLPRLKQPPRLYTYSFLDLWERYGYYTLHSALVLYLITVLHLSTSVAYSIFASFTALLYVTPLVGGYFSDLYITPALSVVLGLFSMSLAYLSLGIFHGSYLLFSLSLLVVGSGFFMPNMSKLVSQLYSEKDVRREGGFSIFYTAINVGAFIPPIISSIIIAHCGWQYIFIIAAAAVFMSALVALFYFWREILVEGKVVMRVLAYFLLSSCVLGIVVSAMHKTQYTDIFIASFAILFLLVLYFKSFDYDKLTKRKIYLAIILTVLSIAFGVLYQQAGMSLTIFTEYNTNRQLFGFSVPTILFQSLNPIFIIILGPFLSVLWTKLGKKNRNLSTASKFGCGTLLMGAGFVLFPIAIKYISHAGLISSSWVVSSYFLQTIGELLVSPIGLAMMSELIPISMQGLMMGAWYFATAVSNAIAGKVSEWTIVKGAHNPLKALPQYSHVFLIVGVSAVFLGICILLMSRVLTKFVQSGPGLTTL